MNKLVLSSLIVALGYSATSESYGTCAGKLTEISDEDLKSCGLDKDFKPSTEFTDEACKYYFDETKAPKTATEEWSEEYGENFHACHDEMISYYEDKGCNDAVIKSIEDQKACSSNVLAAVTLFAAALLF